MLMEKFKTLQHSFNEEMAKAEKGAESIQILQKDLKLAKAARKAADNSTCLHSDSFEVNTGKSQGNESVLVAQLREKLSSFESDQKAAEQIAEEAVAESEVLLQQFEQLKNERDVIVKDKGVIQKEKDDFQQLLQGATTRINEFKKKQIEDNTKLAQVKKDAAAAERKLKRQIALLQQSQTERIVLHNRQMTELREEKEIVSKELEQTKHAKKGLEHINHQKVLKRDATELFNEIERIKSEKESTDTAFALQRNQLKELVETNQLITKVLSDSDVRVKVLQDNLDSLKAEFEPTTLELEKCKQMIQKKDNEILSLSEKHQSGDELVSIMKERVSELQEERANIEMSLKTTRKKYDDEFSSKRKLEREISFSKVQRKSVIVQLNKCKKRPLNRNPHQKQ